MTHCYYSGAGFLEGSHL